MERPSVPGSGPPASRVGLTRGAPTSELGRLNEGRLLSSWLPSRRAAVTGADCGVHPIVM